ncbi:DUF7563 family protein [Halorussus halophilus]|uniref:DUF7563 family protein n=1 Tax=Halorussus halophilus TaxID=2650975 RepID=UPI0017882BDC|nr:hypothetical protein [Halorussus halophilus]
MTNCESCGAFVTEQFARTFGDNTDTVHACPDCTDMTCVKNGAAASSEFERRSHPNGQ